MTLCATGAAAVAALIAASVPQPNPHPTLQLAGATRPATTAQQSSVRAGELLIEAAWMRQPPPGARVGGGYMRITNTGEEPERLIGGAAAFAGLVQIHEMALSDGMMLMREVEGGLEIAPGETLVLAPGSYHVMFMELTEPPAEGETVEATLIFERAGEVTLALQVGGIGANAPGHAGEH